MINKYGCKMIGSFVILVLINVYKANSAQETYFFCLAILDHFQTNVFNSDTTSFQHFSPKDFESLVILDIQLREVGAK